MLNSEKDHISSFHENKKQDYVRKGFLFRFRRQEINQMLYRCVCFATFSSRQSLFNHLKGSSAGATKIRKPCERIDECAKFLLRTPKYINITDDEGLAINVMRCNNDEGVGHMAQIQLYQRPCDEDSNSDHP
jgi:hypothetical protein